MAGTIAPMADSPRVNLPFLTADLPGIGGVLRATEDDFLVDEVPAYPPSGTGDHVFVHIEKRGLTTPQATQAIARALRIKERDIGVAGMKDRHAVTRQWLSLPPPVTPEAASALALEGIRILEAARHAHKLRTGHLRGNRFVLRVRGCDDDAAARARAILDRLAQPPGAPNFYGEQRFGRYGDNAARGRALLARDPASTDRRDGRMDRFLISALQSELFNSWLVARLADGLYDQALAGDVLHKVGGGLFVCDDAATDTQRLRAGEVLVTGPMFGVSMKPATGEAAAREQAILDAAGIAADAFARVARIAEGTRRDASIAVGDVTVTDAGPSTLELAFALPSGAYATTVMREVMKTTVEPERAEASLDAVPEAT
jgi:tRNA pseudouridine13 synthase